jgi:transcriptional regulator with XRE-family HTH domain
MLSNFIKQLREKNNFSQEYMASKIGISRPTYAQIELGKRDLTVIEAKIISDIFGMSLNDFLQEKKLLVDFQIKKSKNKNKKKKEDIRISIPQEKIDKFKQVLLYILEKAGGKPNVGMTVLYKLLYFIDFDYYEKNEEQLMGLVYIKNHYGPTPILFDRVIKEMNKKGEIEVLKSKFYQHPQTKIFIKSFYNTRFENLEW